MRKQFIYFAGLFALSLSLVGCFGAKESAPSENQTEVNIEVTPEAPSENPSSESATEPNAEIVAPSEESTSNDETPKTDSSEQKEDKPESSAVPNKDQTVSNAKPQSSTSNNTATSKPQSGTSNNAATSKPQSGTSNNSANTAKPETNTQSSGNVSAKPESTPTPTPVVPEASTSLSATELYDKMTSGIEFTRQMELDEALLQDTYNIDPSLLKSFKATFPMMSGHLGDCVVLELNNASDASKVVDGINERANNAGIMLYPSLQETYDNRQIVTNGNYVLFVMNDYADQIVANFNNVLK